MTSPPDALRSALAGRYELKHEIGRGGMANVYLAVDTKHGRAVALKVLRPEVAAAVGAERFVQEIMLAARLTHPHILPLLDSGTIDDEFGGTSPYYTMPFIDGESLRARLIRERQLPLEDVMRLGQETAGALDYAHECGIVHRDIKPENILLSNGHAIVADFGIARALTQAGGEKLTSTGIAVGTPAYMSPEQATADGAIDGRTDIYSLGCVLYEAISGDPPFNASTAQAILARRMTESAPRLRVVRETVPESLDRAIAKAIARVPADRFSRAKAFGDALVPSATPDIAAAYAEFPAMPRVRVWRSRAGIGVLGACAGALVAAAVVSLATRTGSPASERSARLTIALPAGDSVVVESGDDHAPSIAVSPDGRRLVYVARSAGSRGRLYIRPVDQYQSSPIVGSEGASNPVFSPNGRWLAFFADSKLKKVSLDGGQPVTLCAASDPEGLDWESDDVLLLTQFNSALLRVPAAGGQPRAIGKLERGEMWHTWPQVLPGAKTVLYVSAGANGSRIMAMSLASGERRIVLEDAAFARSVVGGQLLYVHDGVLVARAFDEARLTLTGAAVPVLEDLLVIDDVVAQISVSRGGDLVYLARGSATRSPALVWVDRHGAATPLPVPPRDYAAPRVSPDGRRIAAVAGAGVGRSEIVVLDPLRDRPASVALGGRYAAPLWTPDGLRIVFGVVGGGVQNLYVQPADGSAAATRLFETSNDQWPGSVSPDGRSLIYMESNPRTQGDILMAPLEGQHTPREVVHSAATEWGGRISPNGRWLAYVSDELGPFDVYVTSFPDAVAKWRISTGGGSEAVWSRDGKELFYRRHDGSIMVVSVETTGPFSASTPRLLFKGPFVAGSPGVPGYDVSPDGTRFLMLRSNGTSAPTHINIVLGWTTELARGGGAPSR